MSTPPAVVERTRWSAVIALGLAVFVAGLDMTIVATALPAMGAELGVAPSTLQWVVLTYSIPMVGLAVGAGRWLDVVNPRAAFALGAIGFALASIAAGLAPLFTVLVVARVAQGAFGAVLSASVFPIAALVVVPARRGRALGVIGTIGPLGSVLGPAGGGLIVAAADWRWVFLVNIPLCACLVILAWRSVPSAGRLRWPGGTVVVDVVLTAGAALALLLAIQRAAHGFDLTVLALTLAAAALAAVWLRLRHSAPIRRALATWKLSGQFLALLLTSTIGGAVYFIVPFAASRTLELDPAATGLALLGMPLGIAAAAQVGGRLSDRVGPKPAALIGAALMVIGAASLLVLDSDWSAIDLTIRLFIIGVGGGLFSAPNLSAIMSATPPALFGVTSGLSTLFRTLGFALGPAIGAALWSGASSAEVYRPAFIAITALPVVAIGILATITQKARESSAGSGPVTRVQGGADDAV